MDILIKTENFLSFLNKCKLGGLVKDLIIWAQNDQIFAKLSDSHASMYCEIFEKGCKVKKEGSIKVATLDKLISVLSRAESELVRLVANETMFVVSDGEGAGKFRTDFVQSGEADFVESYQRIKNYQGKLLNKETLEYVDGKYKFEVGYEIPYESLQTIMKDAKAFGFELYKFKEETKKDGGETLLTCVIEDKSLGEKFTRKMLVDKKIGTEALETCVVGTGFKEMIGSLDKDYMTNGNEKAKRSYKIYFHKNAILITEGQNIWYVLHTLLEN